MSGSKKGKELDPYLKARIGEARFNLEQLIKPSNPSGTKRVYYLGNYIGVIKAWFDIDVSINKLDFKYNNYL